MNGGSSSRSLVIPCVALLTRVRTVMIMRTVRGTVLGRVRRLVHGCVEHPVRSLVEGKQW